jgi:hypothetical protein
MFYNSTDNKLYIGNSSNSPVLISDDPEAIVAQIDAVEATVEALDAQVDALESDSRTTTVGTTEPSSPVEGDLWYNITVGQLMIYTTEWVKANTVDTATNGLVGVYPVTTDEFFDHIVYTTSEQSEIDQATHMIAAATQFAEQYTGRYFVVRTAEQSFDSYPTNYGKKVPLKLGGGLATSILNIQHFDSSFAVSYLTSSDYRQIDRKGLSYIYPAMGKQWPTDVATGEPDVVTVTYTVGLVPAEVPSSIKAAILLMAASLWENRENEIIGQSLTSLKPSMAAKDLLHPYKLR